jgi:purine-binding chemotaxis protein CheW
MSSVQHLVVLALDEQRLAVPLATVDRIVRAVEVTPLPGAPQVVLGVINVQGAVLPVINLRRRCRLPEREIETTDMLVIAHTTRRSVALLVDRADVMEFAAESLTPAEQIVPGIVGVHDVLKHEDGLILLYDPEALLLLEEDIALNGAMAGAADAADAADAEGASDE